MKIAFLHMTLGLADRGSEVTTWMLATELSKKHQILVLYSGKLGKIKFNAKRISPLNVAPSPAPINIFDKLLFRLGLNDSARKVVQFTLASINELTKFKPDVVVATNGGAQVKILRHSLPNTKIVVFGHAGIGHDDLNNIRATPDLFIAISKEAREWALANKKEKTQVEYLPNPTDIKAYQKAKAVDLHMLPPTLLVVGALTAYKNILPLIKVISTLGVNLILIGDGEESREVADVLSHFKSEFRWIKDVKPDEMPSYYKSADAFAFVPDSQEAFGRVYIEAMAAGLPIVATDDTIRRSIIGGKGIYVKVGDGIALQKAIDYALSLPKIDYSSELKEYDLNNVVKKLIKLLTNLLEIKN